jgi:AbrB family looped-hinge helix DNA binding protein
MEEYTVAIDTSGRVLIPAGVRARLGFKAGSKLVLECQEDGLFLRTRDQAIGRVHEIVRRYVPEGTSLVEELLADREREAADE